MKNLQYAFLIGITCLISTGLNAQEITMFPSFWGYEFYQDDERIDREQLASLFENNQETLDLWKKSNTLESLAWVSFAAETGFAIWTFKDLQNDEHSIVPALATLGSAVAVVIFTQLSNKNKKEAILRYNQGLESKTTFRIEPSKNGLGVVLRF